jgi:ABC-type branched-subunit amino acid transport system substrate-binding protein
MENVCVFILYLFGFLRASDLDNVIRIGYITGSRTKENSAGFNSRHGQRISGAITYARNQINNDTGVLPNHTLEFVVAETYSQEIYSIKETVELIDKNISVYIGPQETCIHEGRIAAAFNLPMISYVSTFYITLHSKLYVL